MWLEYQVQFFVWLTIAGCNQIQKQTDIEWIVVFAVGRSGVRIPAKTDLSSKNFTVERSTTDVHIMGRWRWL